MENRNIPILHDISIINYFISILPISVTLIVYIIYFSLYHQIDYDQDHYFFPCTSDIIILQPEYKLFSVSMTIESLLLLFAFYIQDKIRVILGKRLHKTNNRKFTVLRVISYSGFLLYFVGHEILAIIPYKKSKIAVSIGNNMNGFGLICLFISCDVFNAYLNHASSIVSRIITWVVFLTSLFNLLVRFCIFTDDKSSNVQWWTMSTVFFIIEQWCGYIKFTLIALALPPAAIRLSRNIV